MNHKTAVIDIGSNSVRLVIYERSSQFGYRLIFEQKSRVRIGEGAYNNNGNLQPIAIQRAFNTLKSFMHLISKQNCANTITIATSAIRDAPNKSEFIALVKNEIGIDINVISGAKEARYGGIAACSLLYEPDCISIDIGGGSSDLALIKDGVIVDAISLDIGTVRIKELFLDNNKNSRKAKEYIREIVKTIPETFVSNVAIGIGGTARTIASCIMNKADYPLDKIHAFTYELENELNYLKDISNSSLADIKQYPIKSNRHDTIREGIIIFLEILNQIKSKTVVNSSAGVRDGLYLEYLFGSNETKFPKDINPNLESVLDRFYKQNRNWYTDSLKIAQMIINIFKDKIDTRYANELNTAIKLSKSGEFLDIFNTPYNSSYIALHELSYCFTHQQIALISILLSSSDGKINKKEFSKYKSLLPQKNIVKWHIFVYSLTLLIGKYTNSEELELKLEEANTMTIKSKDYLHLLREGIESLKFSKSLNIKIYYP